MPQLSPMQWTLMLIMLYMLLIMLFMSTSSHNKMSIKHHMKTYNMRKIFKWLWFQASSTQ